MNAAKVLPWTGKNRSWKRESWWLAGAAGAGYAVGMLIGGRRGGAIGAISGTAAQWVRRIASR